MAVTPSPPPHPSIPPPCHLFPANHNLGYIYISILGGVLCIRPNPGQNPTYIEGEPPAQTLMYVSQKTIKETEIKHRLKDWASVRLISIYGLKFGFILFMFIRERGVKKLSKHVVPSRLDSCSSSEHKHAVSRISPNRFGRFFTGDFCLIFSLHYIPNN